MQDWPLSLVTHSWQEGQRTMTSSVHISTSKSQLGHLTYSGFGSFKLLAPGQPP